MQMVSVTVAGVMPSVASREVEGSGGGRDALPRRVGPHSFSSFPDGLVGFAFLCLLALACSSALPSPVIFVLVVIW